MTIKKIASFAVSVMLIALGFLSASFLWKVKGKQQTQNQNFQIPLVHKTADVTKTDNPLKSSSGSANNDVSIVLTNWQGGDVLNIRQGDKDAVKVSAGSMLPAPDRLSSMGDMMRRGEPLADSSLNVTADQVIFNRPAPSGNVVFLDIQLPPGRTARVTIDGDLKLKGSIPKPLLWRGGEWMEGSINIPTAMLRATNPRLEANSDPGPDNPILDSSTGYYAVRYSKLEATRRSAVQGSGIVAVLYINESGRVEKVAPLTPNAPENVLTSIKGWTFSPYLINGGPARVMTVVTLR